MGTERCVRQGEADFPVHFHQRQQGIDHHLREDGLSGACRQDCGYGDRLAGTTCGNIFMGAARNKETLEWAQNDVFGKAKQTSRSISINDNKVSTTISEKMDYLVPAAKIADMATGWLAGQAARDFTATDERMLNHFDIEQSEEFKTTKYFCKTHFDMKKIKNEEDHYVPLPKIYEFKNDREKEIMLNRNFKRVNDEVEKMVKELLGMA